MFPVPRMATQVQTEWAAELAARFDCTAEEIRAQGLFVEHFTDDTVRIELMDESVVEFRWAFFIVSEEKRAIAVFTEHCGYHVFPYHEAKVFVSGVLRYEQRYV